MSDSESAYTLPPTSPNQPVHDGILRNPKEFSGALTMELTDSEIAAAFKIIVDLQQRYATKPNTSDVLERLRDEVLTRLSEVGVVASFDPSPCLYGEPPIVDFIGKVSTDDIHKHGFDHEKKEWEVKRAVTRKEDFLGQKGRSR
jgi:hypothetical protein